MKNRKHYVLLSLAGLLFLFCTVLYAYFNSQNERERFKILVLADESQTDRWTVLKQGIDRGALDYNLEVSFLTVSDSLYANEQTAVMNRELENGADGLILDAVSSKSMVHEVDRAAGQIPVVLIETDILSDRVYSCIRPNNYQMGRELGESIIKEMKANQKIGIVRRNTAKNSYSERYRGVMDVLTEHGIRPDWEIEKTMTGIAEKAAGALEEGEEHLIICLGSSDAEEIIDFAVLTGKKMEIFTIGNTEKVVYYLDKELVNTLVVPNEFTMAYMAVQEIARQLEYRTEGRGTVVDHIVVNKDNMYDRNIQKLLFPIVQ